MLFNAPPLGAGGFIFFLQKIVRGVIVPLFTKVDSIYSDPANNIDELVKSLILLAPQAILGFMTRLAKLQELGLTPPNSLQFLTPDAS